MRLAGVYATWYGGLHDPPWNFLRDPWPGPPDVLRPPSLAVPADVRLAPPAEAREARCSTRDRDARL